MNTPPFLLGAALLFWGWQTGYFLVGAGLAVVFESTRVIRARWSFSQMDFDRLWNITTLLFLGAAAYLFVNEGTISFNDFFVDAGRRPEALRQKGRAALLWFQWFPILFAPFMAAAAFSAEQSIEVSTFSWFLRRRRAGLSPHAIERVNVAFPYFAVILMATCASRHEGPSFFIGFSVLMAWVLWSQRGRRFSAVAWVALMLATVAGGYATHVGMARLQKALEEMNLLWFTRVGGLSLETRQARTAIGAIGRLKMSDKIALRLRTDGQPPPELLREASYSLYRAALWVNTNKEFISVFNDTTNHLRWPILPDKTSRRSVNIARYLPGGIGLLPTPTGVSELDQLPVVLLERNALGALRVKGGPGLALYDTRYDERGATFDVAPTGLDKTISDTEEPAVAEVAARLGLREGMKPEEAMRVVGQFFQREFTYSSWLTKDHVARSNETALARFLHSERSGHCEYFASATTLLLRKAGLPTRYAVGFSVQEGAGKKFVVRERHAHAWALVYHDGAWHDFDTTPSGWNAAEGRLASSWLRPFRDFFSDVWFQFSKWRWGSTSLRKYIVWLPVPLLVLAVASFVWKKQWRQVRARGGAAARRRELPGLDSELYALERALAARGLERRGHESWPAWERRVAEHVGSGEVLARVVKLHCQYRFDPEGLSAEERDELRRGAGECGERLKR